jgi:4-amino-4-deoxy-L-arabinose transferase-like glycosyltransferase
LPQGFFPFPGNPQLSPTYAVGLPLHLALAGKLLGWERGPVVVGVLGALAAAGLLAAVARELGLAWPLAIAGVVTLAAFPVFLFMSIQPLSDVLATAWCLAAVFAALRSARAPSWAIACGVAVGLAVLVRATNALVLPTIIVLLGADARRLALAFLGGLPAALWLGYYNHTLYGGALQSGYVNLGEAFAWSYALPTLAHVGKWFALMLPAALLALPFFAIARDARPRRIAIALALWFGGFAAFHVFYEFTREVWWGLRFLLPATPALILGGLIGLEAAGQSPRIRTALAAGLAIWAAGLGWFWTEKKHLLLTRTYEQAYADAAAAARVQFPPGALVLASMQSGALFYYTDFPILRWDFVSPEQWQRFRTLAAQAGRPVCAVLFDAEKPEALEQRCRGTWTQLARLNNLALWRLEAPAAATPAR